MEGICGVSIVDNLRLFNVSMLFLVITAMPTILPSLGDCSSALSHSAFSWFGHIHFTDAYMMDCTEVVVQKAYSEEEIYTEVYTALIERKDAASVLEVFCNEVPLQNYGLNHLKRIQPLDRNDRSGPLQIVVCPVQRFDEVPQRIRDVCTNKRTVKVCSIAPACRQEFEAWNQCWPINFHASHLEKEREKGLSKEDIEQVQIASQHLAEDELLHKWGGALMINPDNGKVVATAAEALSKLVQKAQSAAREWDESACTTVYTPTMLCIEGVAAVVRGDNAVRGEPTICFTAHIITAGAHTDADCCLLICRKRIIVECLPVQRPGPVPHSRAGSNGRHGAGAQSHPPGILQARRSEDGRAAQRAGSHPLPAVPEPQLPGVSIIPKGGDGSCCFCQCGGQKVATRAQ